MEDAELITRLGGPAKVCEILKFDKDAGGVQRVNNWVRRGIPSHIKVKFPELFIPGFGQDKSEQTTHQPAAQAAEQGA